MSESVDPETSADHSAMSPEQVPLAAPRREDVDSADLDANGHDSGAGGVVRGALVMVRELVLVVVIALGLSLLIKTVCIQAFFIPSESMESTLLNGDRILVSKLTPGPIDLKRGDVVVFKDPGGWLDPPSAPDDGPFRAGARRVMTFVGLLPSDSGQHLIKRVIGLPGDTVVCCTARGQLTVNGVAIKEPYIKPGVVPSDQDFTVPVAADRLWVMGDNRSQSRDSRFNRGRYNGTVPVENVVGRAFVVVWPFSRMAWLHGASDSFSGVPAP